MKLLTKHITINPQAKGCGDSFTLFIRLLKSKRVQYILTRIVLMVDQNGLLHHRNWSNILILKSHFVKKKIIIILNKATVLSLPAMQ